MNIHEARLELTEAWAAVPFDMARVARATALLLELCDYNVAAFASRRPKLVVNNDRQLGFTLYRK